LREGDLPAELLANPGVLVFHRTPELVVMVGGFVEGVAQARINAGSLGGPGEIPEQLRAAALLRAMASDKAVTLRAFPVPGALTSATASRIDPARGAGPRGPSPLARAVASAGHTGEGDEEGRSVMTATSDQVKGRAKEAAGVVTGDKDLEAEGKSDRLTGEAEEKIDHAKDEVEAVIDKTKDKVEDLADKTKDALHRK
jgi:uncharacterized protein YjbJ (UPF0337 family)